MWETAERAGIITANLMWYVSSRSPTPWLDAEQITPKARSSQDADWGISDVFRTLEGKHTSSDPYTGVLTRALQDKVPLREKLDQILTWIDLPLEQRPQFIMGEFTVLVACT